MRNWSRMNSGEMARTKPSKMLLLVGYLFSCIYAPPIFPNINFVLLVAAFSIPYIASNYKIVSTILSSKPAKSFCAWFTAFACYWFVITLINIAVGKDQYYSDYITSAYSFFLVAPVCLVCATTVVVIKIKHSLSNGYIIKAIIIAGLIQATLALAAFFFPVVKNALTNVMFNNTGGSQLKEGLWISERRFYGFANSMLDLYGLGTGLIAAMPAFLVMIDPKSSKCWLISIPILLTVPALNARTGLVVFLVAILVASLCFGRVSGLSVVAAMFSVCIIALIGIGLLSIIAAVRPEIIEWLLGDITGETQHNTFEILFGKGFWHFPDPVFSITGTGHSVYTVAGFSHSDVGYVNEIWRTGFIGLLMLVCAFSRPVLYVLKNESSERSFNYLIAGSIICLSITAVKCMPITHSGGMIIIITLFLLGGVGSEESIETPGRSVVLSSKW